MVPTRRGFAFCVCIVSGRLLVLKIEKPQSLGGFGGVALPNTAAGRVHMRFGCVVVERGDDLAVREQRDFEEMAWCIDFGATAVGVDGAGYHGGVVVFADQVFEFSPRASIQRRVLWHSVTGEECVGGVRYVGRGDEVAAVEAAVGEGVRAA